MSRCSYVRLQPIRVLCCESRVNLVIVVLMKQVSSLFQCLTSLKKHFLNFQCDEKPDEFEHTEVQFRLVVLIIDDQVRPFVTGSLTLPSSLSC